MNSRKFKLLIHEDEELLTKPHLLEHSLSIMPPASANDVPIATEPSLDRQNSTMSRQISIKSRRSPNNARSIPFVTDV